MLECRQARRTTTTSARWARSASTDRMRRVGVANETGRMMSGGTKRAPLPQTCHFCACRAQRGNSQCLAKSSPYVGPSAGAEVARVYGSATLGALWTDDAWGVGHMSHVWQNREQGTFAFCPEPVTGRTSRGRPALLGFCRGPRPTSTTKTGGAPKNPAPRNHLLAWTIKPSSCHCTDASGGTNRS